MTMLEKTFSPFFHFVRSFFLGLSPAIQLLQAHYLRRKFTIKVKYASQPIVVRGRTSDVTVFYEIFALRIYKIPKTEIMSVIDLGANVGYASIYFSHFCPNARIIAVEPEHSNYQSLAENTQNIKNIACVHAAIWPEETQLTLQNPSAPNWSFHYEEAVKTSSGPVIKTETLPGLMKKYDLKRINLLKIDIEGAEKNLFASNTDWLQHVDYLQIEIHSDEAKKIVFNALKPYPHTYIHDGFNNYCVTFKN